MRKPAGSLNILPDTPATAIYKAARQEYNEQVGTIVAQRDGWRMAALGSIAVSMLAVAGGIWDHMNNHPVPYVVRVDRLGDSLAVGRADVATPIDNRIIRAQIARWVWLWRSVISDKKAELRNVQELFAMIDKGGPASQMLNAWFAENSPFRRGDTETVSVQVISVIPRSPKTWDVQWREDHWAKDGNQLPSDYWRALLTINIDPPKTDTGIFKNWSGLFVEAVAFQKDITR